MPSISACRTPTATPAGSRAMTGLCSCLHRLDDLDVAGAAAQVAGEGRADRGLVGRWVAAQQRFGRHDHARRAEAALRAELLVESTLQRAQRAFPVLRFDGLDRAAFAACGEREAGKPRLAVDQHRARAAFATVAAALRARQTAALAQVVEEKQVVLDRLLASAPVYGERNALGHSSPYASRAMQAGFDICQVGKAVAL